MGALRKWQEVAAFAPEGVAVFLVATKADLWGTPQAQVTEEEVRERAAALGLPLVVTSSKTGEGIEGLLGALAGCRGGTMANAVPRPGGVKLSGLQRRTVAPTPRHDAGAAAAAASRCSC